MILKLSNPKYIIILIVSILLIVSSNLNWGGNHWKGIIKSDAKGYYAYLPATFIYNDLNFKFFDSIEKKKYYDENWYYDYRSGAYGKTINKYYCGTAVLESPFFLMAHWLSYLFNYEQDGYSKLYQVFINLSGVFYLFLGLWYLNLMLKKIGISNGNRSVVLTTSVLGTNLFYYSVIEPGMSHVYSFAIISMFLYYTHQYFVNPKASLILLLFSLLGIIILIRPSNGLIIFAIPFISIKYDFLKEGIRFMFKQLKWLLVSIVALFVIVFTQLLIYKVSTGHYVVYSYLEEGFNFLSPNFFDILFSYKKGLFLYTPVFFVSLSGLLFLYKQSRYQFYGVSIFLILITYVLSSWWMWYYGGSFSSRVYVEYIPIFMMLLGLGLNKIKKTRIKNTYIAILGMLIVVCQIQTYQYRYFEIHWDNMTKEKYWNVFMRIDKLIK
jgi:hypothetical protein